jgi:uncharacterized membrane protein
MAGNNLLAPLRQDSKDRSFMYKQLKDYGRLNESFFLGSLTCMCFAFSVFRFVYTDTKVFLFLNWNLFLAFLPWLFTTILTIYPKLKQNKLVLVALVFSWLLFFPNSLYILTDLFHLQLETSMPKWFDLVLILSFAWTGLMFGFMSLWDIEKIIGNKINKGLMPVVSLFLLFMGSFGIYLGRYLRWNSWDIITEPFYLFYDISDRIIKPFQHKGAWGMTLFMFIFLSMIYWSFRFIKRRS